MEAMRDPNMANMLNNPMFQNMAQQAMQNPEMLRNMMGAMGGMGGGGGGMGGGDGMGGVEEMPERTD